MIAALLPLLVPIIDRLVDSIPDPGEKERQKTELLNQLMATASSVDLAQLDVNKVEAAHPNIFVSGWRPWIGWVCGMAVAWEFVLAKIAAWAVSIWAPGTPIPQFGTDGLMELTLGMLGMAGLRSYEKLRGVAK